MQRCAEGFNCDVKWLVTTVILLVFAQVGFKVGVVLILLWCLRQEDEHHTS
jgi:phage shock protein PspC (stress-responsive transcriptional regulator)